MSSINTILIHAVIEMFVSISNNASNIDHFDPIYKCMFIEVLGPQQERRLVDILKSQKFSLMVDESTDRNTDKQLVILARVFTDGGVSNKFIDMPVCNLGTAADIFGVIDRCFR